jgi:DNA-binding MarR family transcriptional regulator
MTGESMDIVTETELFQACLKSYREGIARAASVALFWSQFAKHRLRGRVGIYKTDADLGQHLGKHPKVAGSNLMEVCAKPGESARGFLFEVAYGPKAGQDGGRCRWLFLTPKGAELIDAVRDERLARESARREKRMRQPRAKKAAAEEINVISPVNEAPFLRSPQNTPTLFTEDSSVRRPNKLSRTTREISVESSEEIREEIDRIPGVWNLACERIGRQDLMWRRSEVSTFRPEFREIASLPFVRQMTDEVLLARLKLLCEDLKSVSSDLSEAFSKFNRPGLKAQSFAKYGERLLELAGERISKSHSIQQQMLKAVDL